MAGFCKACNEHTEVCEECGTTICGCYECGCHSQMWDSSDWDWNGNDR